MQQLERTRKRVSELRALGPLPSLSLRYLAQRSDLSSGPIATTRPEHLEQSLAAIRAERLSASEVATIETALQRPVGIYVSRTLRRSRAMLDSIATWRSLAPARQELRWRAS